MGSPIAFMAPLAWPSPRPEPPASEGARGFQIGICQRRRRPVIVLAGRATSHAPDLARHAIKKKAGEPPEASVTASRASRQARLCRSTQSSAFGRRTCKSIRDVLTMAPSTSSRALLCICQLVASQGRILWEESPISAVERATRVAWWPTALPGSRRFCGALPINQSCQMHDACLRRKPLGAHTDAIIREVAPHTVPLAGCRTPQH